MARQAVAAAAAAGLLCINFQTLFCKLDSADGRSGVERAPGVTRYPHGLIKTDSDALSLIPALSLTDLDDTLLSHDQQNFCKVISKPGCVCGLTRRSSGGAAAVEVSIKVGNVRRELKGSANLAPAAVKIWRGLFFSSFSSLLAHSCCCCTI